MRGYTIVEIDDREKFIKAVLAQDVHFHIPDRYTPFSKAVMQQWPKTIWCQVRWEVKIGYVFPTHYPWVAKIPTKTGKVIVWRNGGDRGDYNFLVYVEATKEFHPRPNIKDVIDLIEMITNPDDAVLFIGMPLGERNKAYLEKILRG